MPFFDRRHELAQLDEAYRRSGGQLFVLYGRRRVGKTQLLNHWLATRKHPALFFTADRTSAANQLRDFSRTVRAALGVEASIPEDFTYRSWELALAEIGRLSANRRWVVVLDEFTYLLESAPALASIVQRLWDHQLKKANVLLVLTGSHAGMIEREVLAYRSPLYMRATYAHHLQPLPFGVLRQWFPRYNAIERVTLYGILGGVPQYLEMVDRDKPLEYNLKALLGTKLIIDDAGALLRDQLQEPRNYVALVEAIASGRQQLTDMAEAAGLPPTNVSKYLAVLRRLGIVERDVPATESRPERSKKGRYRITDDYLRFYYRFLARERANLERGLIPVVWGNLRQHLSEYIGTHVFEALCREYVFVAAAAGNLFLPRRVGAFWGTRQPQIDVVAINEDTHDLLLGECKWTTTPLSAAVVTSLVERSERVIPAPRERWRVTYAFFSRSGFAPEARTALGRRPGMWISLEDLDRALTSA